MYIRLPYRIHRLPGPHSPQVHGLAVYMPVYDILSSGYQPSRQLFTIEFSVYDKPRDVSRCITYREDTRGRSPVSAISYKCARMQILR